MVAVEVFVGQDFVAELRAVLPVDDGLGDFPFQERLDVLAVRDVFVVRHVVPVRPFDGEDFIGIGKGGLEFLGGVVAGLEVEFGGGFLAGGFDAGGEFDGRPLTPAPLPIGWGEGILNGWTVSQGDARGLAVPGKGS